MLPRVKKPKKRIYLDHAATTYLDPKVQKIVNLTSTAQFGNPSSLYLEGRQAKSALESARKDVAAVLKCRADEIIFTAGGTESINTAIFGIVRNFRLSNKGKTAHVITSSIEHHAVLNSIRALEQEGTVKATFIKPDKQGFVHPEDVVRAIKPDTILVSVMYANNEIGTIQPIHEIARAVHKANSKTVFHSDACQASGALDLEIYKLGVDLLTLNGSKVYGPKQSGILFVRKGLKLEPLIYGGGQEMGLRSGTENVAGAVGFAQALQTANKTRLRENSRLRSLRSTFYKAIQKNISEAFLNGPDLEGDTEKDPKRLPNNLNLSFLGVEGEAMVLYLDSYQIAVSTGSACSTTNPDPSHVILGIGRPHEYALSSIRFTLGKQTIKAELDYVLKVLVPLVAELRRVA